MAFGLRKRALELDSGFAGHPVGSTSDGRTMSFHRGTPTPLSAACVPAVELTADTLPGSTSLKQASSSVVFSNGSVDQSHFYQGGLARERAGNVELDSDSIREVHFTQACSPWQITVC